MSFFTERYQSCMAHLLDTASKFAFFIFDVRFERRKLDKKSNCIVLCIVNLHEN